MQIKYLTEKFLKDSGSLGLSFLNRCTMMHPWVTIFAMETLPRIRHTILRISGLMQPLISQYAVSRLATS